MMRFVLFSHGLFSRLEKDIWGKMFWKLKSHALMRKTSQPETIYSYFSIKQNSSVFLKESTVCFGNENELLHDWSRNLILDFCAFDMKYRNL
ncbi:hypothetical protein Nmel_012706 [Mimus melanotis]